jgi:hypothetical protein
MNMHDMHRNELRIFRLCVFEYLFLELAISRYHSSANLGRRNFDIAARVWDSDKH